jgi:hypothetical protein
MHRADSPAELPSKVVMQTYSFLHTNGVQINGSIHSNYLPAPYATQLQTAIRAGLTEDQGRANWTVTPTASPFQLRSVVSTGWDKRLPRARQARSPSERPASRVDSRS